MNRHFTAGVKAGIPPSLGAIPVGISTGLLALRAGLTPAEAIFMSAAVFAGSAELMAIGMIGQGAAASAVILGTFFINLRHLVMSSSVMKRMRGASVPVRLAGAFALCDESFAVFSLSADDSAAFLFGANTAMYVCYVGSTAAGCLMNGVLPKIAADSFGIAFFAAFLGMLLPAVRGNARLILLVLLTAAMNGLLGLVLPPSWAVILSMVLGAFIGVFLVGDKPADDSGKGEES